MKNNIKKHLRQLVVFCVSVAIISCNKIDSNDNSTDSQWSQLGSSFYNEIYDIIPSNDGKIYISGGESRNILIWNGTNWSKIGDINASPFTGGIDDFPITVDRDGNVYAVGRINVPQANSEFHVAKWSKSSNEWINLTSNGPLFDNGIFSFVTDTLGNLYVAGNVIDSQLLNLNIESGNYIYKWDGSTWRILGGTKLPSSEEVYMHIDNNGNLFASFYNNNMSPCVSKWNGSNWEELGGTNTTNFGTGQIKCIASDSKGNIYAGGYFVSSEDSAYNIYKWTKATNSWTAMHTNMNASFVYSIAIDTDDNLYVAGDFKNTLNARYIAKYQNNKWSDYGYLNANNTINSICFDKDGNMYAGGMFTDGNNKHYVAVYKKKIN
jgi:hypothetical protein